MEETAAPPDFKDRDGLTAWLATQPREVAIIIAARAALRVLPMLSQFSRGRWDPGKLAEVAGKLLRAIAIARVAAKYPTRAEGLRDAALLAAYHARAVPRIAEAAARAADCAAEAGASPDHPAGLSAGAVASAASAAASNSAVIWEAVSADVRFLGAAPASAQTLADFPLWLKESTPSLSNRAWADLFNALPGDRDWDVWFQWCESRLNGSSIPEEIERAYTLVPQEKWDEGPAAANAWIKAEMTRLRKEQPRRSSIITSPEFEDRESLNAWLRSQSSEVTVTIAARAALRVLPELRRYAASKLLDQNRIAESAANIFRANAVARVAGKYPNRAPDLRPAAYAATTAIDTDNGSNVAGGAAYAAAIAVTDPGRAGTAIRSLTMRAETDGVLWVILADASFLNSREGSPKALAELPLWPPFDHPTRVDLSWLDLFDTLPHGQGWDVWIDWYRARLKGGPSPEEIELVYARIPQEKWDEGPAAANAWIKEQLRLLKAPQAQEEKNPKEEPELPRFKDRESLEAWLRTQPLEVAVMIAARAALRVLPWFSRAAGPAENARQYSKWALSLFRLAGIISIGPQPTTRTVVSPYWIDAVYKYGASTKFADPAARDAAEAIGAAATAAEYLPNFTSLAQAASGVAYAVSAAAASALAVDRESRADDIWTAVRADASNLADLKGSPLALAGQALWLKGAPDWVPRAWSNLHAALPNDEDWDVWFDWYKARLVGRFPRETDLAYATVPREKWDEGPAAANAWIKAELARLRRHGAAEERLAVQDSFEVEVIPGAGRLFLSYSTKDESFARFVDDVLRQAGYRVFAQFRDIPAGANFVIEMQKGLAASKRVVALLSPNYVVSEHCQAEWSSAYADDPSGAMRKLVPLLIAPADLAPLARQIVFKSLVGLSGDDAVDVILEAIGHRDKVSPNETWPGAEVLDEAARETEDSYHIEPSGPERILKRRLACPTEGLAKTEGYTAEQLYVQMRRDFEKILEHVHALSIEGAIRTNFKFSDALRRYLSLLLAATPEDFTRCDLLAVNGALSDVLHVLRHDREQGLLPPHDLIEKFQLDLLDHYERLAVIFPSLKKWRRQSRKRRGKSPPREAVGGLHHIAQVAAEHPEVIDTSIASDLRATEAATEATKNIPAFDAEQDQEAMAEPHHRAAAQVIPLWNWLANPKEKFVKTGEDANEIAGVIQNYGKVYKLMAAAKPYFDWLLSVWYS